MIAIGCGLGLLLSILSFCIAGGIVWMQESGQIGTPIPRRVRPERTPARYSRKTCSRAASLIACTAGFLMRRSTVMA